MPRQDQEATSQGSPDIEVPQPPPFHPRPQFAPLQLIGIPLLALLPILALIGIFGESMSSVQASNAEIALQVDYVSRLRYRMQDALTVAVTNLSQQSP